MRQVWTLAICQIVQGALEGVWGLVFAISPADSPNGDATVVIALFVAGLLISLLGLCRIGVGIANLFLRGRVAGMAVLCVGLLSSLSCCCGPSSLALCLYGLIQYGDPEVRRLFAL